MALWLVALFRALRWGEAEPETEPSHSPEPPARDRLQGLEHIKPRGDRTPLEAQAPWGAAGAPKASMEDSEWRRNLCGLASVLWGCTVPSAEEARWGPGWAGACAGAGEVVSELERGKGERVGPFLLALWAPDQSMNPTPDPRACTRGGVAAAGEGDQIGEAPPALVL